MSDGALHLWERWVSSTPANVILLSALIRLMMLSSSVGLAVFESTLIIQLSAYILDNKRDITFVGGMVLHLPHKYYSYYNCGWYFVCVYHMTSLLFSG